MRWRIDRTELHGVPWVRDVDDPQTTKEAGGDVGERAHHLDLNRAAPRAVGADEVRRCRVRDVEDLQVAACEVGECTHHVDIFGPAVLPLLVLGTDPVSS